MDSMIREINDKLKAILDTIKNDKDSAIEALNNIQNQMDSKIEEAKGYKEQVDAAKERIRLLEDENSSLDDSLKELNDKYSKMNLVSVIEAGNKEIKNKINDNIKMINKEKEQIADLTNKARTIKDLLISLKKDRTIKESKLENINVVYDYYIDRVNTVIDYAFDHANTLDEYKDNTFDVSFDNTLDTEDVEEINDIDIDNTMVFDQIANINDLDFRDTLSYLDDEETNDEDNDYFDKDKFNEIIKSSLDQIDFSQDNIDEEVKEPSETTQLFNTIENIEDYVPTNEELEEKVFDTEDTVQTEDTSSEETSANNIFDTNDESDTLEEVNESNLETFNEINTNIFDQHNDEENIETFDENNDSEDRLNKINDLFTSINTNEVSPVETIQPLEPVEVNEVVPTESTQVEEPFINKGIEEKIDNAYEDVFGTSLEDNDINKKDPTLTDIFGNPIKQEEISEEVKISKKIEELFNENGIDFNKFREDEQNYLKQIYDEEKYASILNVLNNNKIDLDNIYHSFNIFGEISPEELNNIVTKLVSVGQSAEAIGFILEKLPKVKKYDLDAAISSFGNYINDVDITELIMKAKELYNNGGNN